MKRFLILQEIYTEDHGDRPIVIQGAGAGSAVTAEAFLEVY
jgi:homoserine dehydrogenase